ncbi:glycosyltransferase family 4 protein [Pseudobutyrivibrio xylanivorans]|uniref:Glycosyltransferase involved in cell wall bisynthesis n=1 Tax=Pseudobutyrivibrio xylanivorans TaxID=185007 RepID=A0A1G5RY70_PSEXY|nr:glycosyltransferase family 4 protein [Pseudobutyrivibrio xylanivorans]SCZ78700.1 Glycosyltransferase involved in cell wall bisynthesis [Pseudobutyrivibrio xylanivorans]
MKKHILIVCQYFYPEPFRISDIAFEWVKRGYKVTVVTGLPNYPEGKIYPGYGLFKKRRETINGVDVIRIPLIPRGKGKFGLVMNYFSFPFFGFFWNLFTKIKADEVFMLETSPMNQCKVGVAYAKKHNVPCYLYVQDLWPENVEMITGIHSPLVVKPIERMVRKIYKGCTHIWGTSPSFVEAIRKYVDPAEHDKVSFWPQYAEEFYEPKEKKAHKGFNVIFTGNIGQAQGLEILPEAASIIRKEGIKDVRFTIVGDGRARHTFEDSITKAGVWDLFEFTGRVKATEVPDYLATGDAAFLSFADDDLFAKTIPAKLQSYMACAMPIIASAKGETVRVITEADCGMCSDIGDAEALACNIIAMRNLSASRLTEMSENAYAYNKEHFSKKKLMDEIDEYFK